MEWQKEITKEEIRNLELKAYEGEIVVVENKQDIPQIVQVILRETIVGVDTETKPTFKKGKLNAVALLQIATHNAVYLIRLNKTGFHPDLKKIFESKKLKKIGIAIDNDIKELREHLNFIPENVLDLNTHCTKLGFKSIGVKKLSAIFLGYRISKRQQISNWEADVLSTSQLRYAATDAWVCREIFIKLNSISL